MLSELIEKFEAEWKSAASVPDVFAFLKQHNVSDKSQTLAILLRDQEHRWRVSRPLTVEEYLLRLPELASDPDCKLQLAVAEYHFRQKSADWPSVSEFVSRFADISEPLRRQLLDAATVAHGVDASELANTQSDTTGGGPIVRNIGRYRILRVLGEGAFGRVYLGYDDELRRPVAIKVPTPERVQQPKDAEAFLAEARTVAGLDHPNIVPVHDIGRTDSGLIYVVSRFIEGPTLSERLKQQRPDYTESTQLLATVARALQYAHLHRVIHRDIKPGNILIEAATGNPYVADFGLAQRDDEFLTEGKVVGTPSYMSPEQARGEGHRLDARSDIFALGTVLYQMLTGRKPFRGSTVNEVLHEVVSVDPPPPREINAAVPAELERICLKALSKRVSDRYASAAEFADDLLQGHWKPQQEKGNLQIIPRGLRSFDASDSDFFPDLLPGPRNREGLSESIQFWKTRLEETDPDATFPVGLIYGPSGCGKSSLVKAGLLPKLSKHVRAIYVEATLGDTEARILRGIRKAFPDISSQPGLIQTLHHLRHSRNGKVVLVIDQFEQWLHSSSIEQESTLVAALRQCDGGTLQAVIMVRDDFAMAAARFMDAIDIPIVQGHNFATIDLFDENHARKVLSRFGQAFGKLPARKEDFSTEQDKFLTSVTTGLSSDGKVVPVQLALFAEMIRAKPWTLSTLQQVGGTDGIGVNFLEETFSSRSANPKHLQHQQAARDVLKALLPEIGSDIKGHMRSQAELMQISGYLNRPKEFNELLRILDGELRLMTPTDPDGFRSDSGSSVPQRHYQLTHDYLVPSLRDWLTRKQTETKRGRMEIRLQERTLLWSSRREHRQLPSFLEWLGILRHTQRSARSPSSTAMMHAATGVYLRRILSSVALIAVLFAGLLYVRHVVQQRTKSAQIANLVDDLWKSRIEHVPEILATLEPDRTEWIDRVQRVADSPESKPAVRARAQLALSADDGRYVPELTDRLLECEADEHVVLCQGLARWKKELAQEAWARVEGEEQKSAQIIRTGALLAQYSPDTGQWASFAPDLVDALVSSDPFFVKPWVDELTPVRLQLLPRLKQTCMDGDASPGQQALAAGIIAQFCRTDEAFPEDAELVAIVLGVDVSVRILLDDVISQRRDRVLPLVLSEAAVELSSNESAEYQRVVKKKAAAALVAQRLGHDTAFRQHLNDDTDPRVRTVLINDFGQASLSWTQIKQQLQSEPPRSRQAIVLGLPQLLPSFSERDIADAQATLLRLFRTDPDAGVHSAAGFVMRTTGAEEAFTAAQEQLARERAVVGNWHVLANGLCMVSVERPGSVTLGSRAAEPDLDGRLPRQTVTIDYSFEISTTEITVQQFRQFQADVQPAFAVTFSADCPINNMDLFSAMRFCRWLSEQEPDFDPDRCVYPKVEQIGPGLLLAEDYLRWPGFRLPTVQEWEYAARAGSETNRFFGDEREDLDSYCWWVETSQERQWPVGLKRPNPWGLFDVHGNVMEWCHAAGAPFDSSTQPTRGGDYRSTPRFLSSAFPTYQRSTAALSTDGFRVVRIREKK